MASPCIYNCLNKNELFNKKVITYMPALRNKNL